MTPERKALRAANSAIERRLAGGEFHPPPCIPEPTTDLSEAERALWEELGNRLFSFGLVSALDSVTFHMLVTGTIRYQQLRAELAGLPITDDKAASVERRLLMQRKELAQLAAYFGMAPSLRHKVSGENALKPEEDLDPDGWGAFKRELDESRARLKPARR